MSTLWNLFEANKMKIKKRLKKVGKDYTILMGQNVELKPGVHIEDNVVIGDNSIIGPNCYIRGDTSIGSNCRIGNGVEIKNSIIMDNSNVPHLSYIGDSIIGEHCNMGAGTISGNLRHDKMNVKILVKGEVVESDRYKLGFIAAHWTKTGVGTMIYPGMILGPFSWTAPNETVNVNIEPFTLLGIKGKQKIPKEKIETAVKDEQDKRFLRRVYEELEDMKY
jgi:bifunctional UDP-N-acetylglucosamine pyrophosphorylase/glucosamine-1-phosphate N-acetyltransferase